MPETDSLDDLLHQSARLDAELGPEPGDLRDPAALTACRRTADDLLASGASPERLWELEQAAARSPLSAVTKAAIKLARSRAFLRDHRSPLTVSLVVPAYGENVRLLPRGSGPGQHPDGEDFVRQKHAQLEWLFEGTAHQYVVVVVDDMSKPEPVTSGEAIATAIEQAGAHRWQVVFLADGVRGQDGDLGLIGAALRGVQIPKNTRKAGAVYYGAATAIRQHGRGPEHLVALTDCDLSVDVAQLGNLIAPIAGGEAAAVAGSRRLPESVLEIEPGRNVRANAARYFRELLLTGLLPRDTQCGAKAFAAEPLARVIEDGLDVLDFSFDIELLTKLALACGPERIVPVPVAWFDSSELTTTDSSVHHRIMQVQLGLARSGRTGSGPVFDAAAAVAATLSEDEGAWLAFLDLLATEPRVLAGVETFDVDVLPALAEMARTAQRGLHRA
ncbi:MAG: hypothetical protein ACRCYQ_06765 [Nocardioides sp.]